MKATASWNLSGGRITHVLVRTGCGALVGVAVGFAPRLDESRDCSGLEELTLKTWELSLERLPD
jgi:hypothetical protein